MIDPYSRRQKQIQTTQSWAQPSFFKQLAKKRIFPVTSEYVSLEALAPLPQRLAQSSPENLRSDLVSLEIAQECNQTPLFFFPEEEDDESGDRRDFPPGLLVLSPAIGPSASLSTDMLRQFGLTPATKFAVVMALLGKVEENAAHMKARYRPWTDQEHQRHVIQVQYILLALEQMEPEQRSKAITHCRRQLFLHTHAGGAPARTQPLCLVTDLYIHSSVLAGLFERATINAQFVNTCYLRDFEKEQADSLEVSSSQCGAFATLHVAHGNLQPTPCVALIWHNLHRCR